MAKAPLERWQPSLPEAIYMPSVAENLDRLHASIASASRRAGRQPEEVELVAVSKTHPVSCLIEAAQAGHLLFGENRVQEFAGKTSKLEARGYSVQLHPAQGQAAQPAPLRVQLIGHLQSNKAARAVDLFTGIDTLDSLKLAERLHEAASGRARRLPVLLEIKMSHEPSKEGLAPDSPELAALLERLPDLTGLVPGGLMTVAPIDEDPDEARRCFRRLRLLRESLAQHHPKLSFPILSMGMSGDFVAAIEEGSTQVRLGTAIFGPRPKPV